MASPPPSSRPLPARFFSCDWGTSSFRLRIVDTSSGTVLRQVINNRGVRDVAAGLPPHAGATERALAFETELAQHILSMPDAQDALSATAPVVVSGMASSTIGWKELPYARTPFCVDGSNAAADWISVRLQGPRTLPVLLISGLATHSEMMRGEETQLIGLLAQPEFAACRRDGLVILPGTHSKHIRVLDNHVVDFHTYLTGELFQVIREHSILRFTTSGDASAMDPDAFREGVAAARDQGLPRSLFQVRSRSVLGGKSPSANRSFLSGLLVGAELADLVHQPGTGPVLLAAAGTLADHYRSAAETLGIDARFITAGPSVLEKALVSGHIELLRHA